MLQPGTRGHPNAKILIVGEAYGEQEAARQQPFVGASGEELNKMLTAAGIDKSNCYFTNIVNERPDYNEMFRFFLPRESKAQALHGLHPGPKVIEGLWNLDQLITKLQPKIIVGLGNYPLWALTGEAKIRAGAKAALGYNEPTGITDFRGSMMRTLHGIPFLPTFHPAAILRNWAWRRMVVHDFRARIPMAFRGEWDEPNYNFLVQPTFEQVMETLEDLFLRAELAKGPLMLTVDVETLHGALECVGVGWSDRDALCIPLMCRSNPDGYFTAREEADILMSLKRLLEHKNVFVTGQNFIYDIQYLEYYCGIFPNYRNDTMLGQHLCFPGAEMSLGHISSMYCRYHRYWKDDGKEANKNHNDLQRWIYNARDCVVTFESMQALWKLIKHYGLERQYAIQMLRANASSKMTSRGVRVDFARRKAEQIRMLETKERYEADLEMMVPPSILPRDKKKKPWYRSPHQQQQLFYDILNFTPIINRKTGRPTIDGAALKSLQQQEPALHHLIKTLLEYSSLDTSEEFLHMSLGPDQRIRCTFSPTTETLRYRSSSHPLGYGRNLQNIPSGQEDGYD